MHDEHLRIAPAAPSRSTPASTAPLKPASLGSGSTSAPWAAAHCCATLPGSSHTDGDGERSRAAGGAATGRHGARQGVTSGGVEGGSEACLGFGEGLHGDEHDAACQGGQAHGRCGHAASVRALPAGNTRP